LSATMRITGSPAFRSVGARPFAWPWMRPAALLQAPPCNVDYARSMSNVEAAREAFGRNDWAGTLGLLGDVDGEDEDALEMIATSAW